MDTYMYVYACIYVNICVHMDIRPKRKVSVQLNFMYPHGLPVPKTPRLSVGLLKNTITFFTRYPEKKGRLNMLKPVHAHVVTYHVGTVCTYDIYIYIYCCRRHGPGPVPGPWVCMAQVRPMYGCIYIYIYMHDCYGCCCASCINIYIYIYVCTCTYI